MIKKGKNEIIGVIGKVNEGQIQVIQGTDGFLVVILYGAFRELQNRYLIRTHFYSGIKYIKHQQIILTDI